MTITAKMFVVLARASEKPTSYTVSIRTLYRAAACGGFPKVTPSQ